MQYIDGDDMIDGDEYVGQEADILGQVARQLVRRPGPGAGRRIFKRPPLPARSQQPTQAELRAFLGFGPVTWAVADGADKQVIVEPQETFRIERLIVEVSVPATITNAPLILVRRLEIGTLPQSPSVEFGTPAALFRADAVGSMMELQIADAGTKISLTMQISAAPTGTGVVTATMGVYGQWIR